MQHYLVVMHVLTSAFYSVFLILFSGIYQSVKQFGSILGQTIFRSDLSTNSNYLIRLSADDDSCHLILS